MTTLSLKQLPGNATTGSSVGAGSGCDGGGCGDGGGSGEAGTLTIVGKPSTKDTGVGNYFVANYPPFGFWKPDHVGAFVDALDRPARPGVDMGIYAHIPFCRKRCHFCYFRVYTDKNARDIRSYIDALHAELADFARRPAISGRKPKFVYFGGGTPSYLSAEQLKVLFEGMKRIVPWDEAEEVTLECEPGTLNDQKLRALKDLGVTRLSMGIEHFDDYVLEVNGRAHRSKEIWRAYEYAREIGFDQVNIDLIAGMVEETDQRWRETVAKAIALKPDAVTIYQMEVPYNTTIYKRMQETGALVAPVADWETKRRWVSEAFDEFCRSGYRVAAATTVVREDSKPFLYRKGLFDGTDILSIGVSSFGHISGVNYQNQHDFQPYLDKVLGGEMATFRAYPLSRDEVYTRELALQFKSGLIDAGAFARKFGTDPRLAFGAVFDSWRRRGVLVESGDVLSVTRAGLMEIDRLIYEFFRPEHQTGRYA
jgi:oxygen-independent coproporphyrinogen-3 oxidase